MTLIYEVDLDIRKLCLHTKMKFLSQSSQKLENEQNNRYKWRDRQTDRCNQMYYHVIFAGGDN